MKDEAADYEAADDEAADVSDRGQSKIIINVRVFTLTF
jgi:hypothetical protein